MRNDPDLGPVFFGAFLDTLNQDRQQRGLAKVLLTEQSNLNFTFASTALKAAIKKMAPKFGSMVVKNEARAVASDGLLTYILANNSGETTLTYHDIPIAGDMAAFGETVWAYGNFYLKEGGGSNEALSNSDELAQDLFVSGLVANKPDLVANTLDDLIEQHSVAADQLANLSNESSPEEKKKSLDELERTYVDLQDFVVTVGPANIPTSHLSPGMKTFVSAIVTKDLSEESIESLKKDGSIDENGNFNSNVFVSPDLIEELLQKEIDQLEQVIAQCEEDVSSSTTSPPTTSVETSIFSPTTIPETTQAPPSTLPATTHPSASTAAPNTTTIAL